jgi:hypothetical protein
MEREPTSSCRLLSQIAHRLLRPTIAACSLFAKSKKKKAARQDAASHASLLQVVPARTYARSSECDQPAERTSLPGRAPVSSPFSKMGVPAQIVMS